MSQDKVYFNCTLLVSSFFSPWSKLSILREAFIISMDDITEIIYRLARPTKTSLMLDLRHEHNILTSTYWPCARCHARRNSWYGINITLTASRSSIGSCSLCGVGSQFTGWPVYASSLCSFQVVIFSLFWFSPCFSDLCVITLNCSHWDVDSARPWCSASNNFTIYPRLFACLGFTNTSSPFEKYLRGWKTLWLFWAINVNLLSAMFPCTRLRDAVCGVSWWYAVSHLDMRDLAGSCNPTEASFSTLGDKDPLFETSWRCFWQS